MQAGRSSYHVRLPTLAACALLLGCVAGARSREPAVRQALEAQYARIASGIMAGDLAAILSVQDSTFTSANPNGQRFDYAAMAAYTRQMVARVDSVIFVHNTIRALALSSEQGDTATVDVCQEFSRFQRFGDGPPRRVDTSALQTETWVRRPAGWRRANVTNVHGTRWFVDGKRVDQTKPFDPVAPPYAPAVDPPTGCGRH